MTSFCVSRRNRLIPLCGWSVRVEEELLVTRESKITVNSALVPVRLGAAGDRRGAERRTSGVNLVAVKVMVSVCKSATRLRQSRTGELHPVTQRQSATYKRAAS